MSKAAQGSSTDFAPTSPFIMGHWLAMRLIPMRDVGLPFTWAFEKKKKKSLKPVPLRREGAALQSRDKHLPPSSQHLSTALAEAEV